jgi:hypothetical protein
MSDFPYVLPENTELSDWTPPVDPDLLVVREISAKQFEGAEAVVSADIRLGKYDGDAVLICALAAYKAGKAAQ